MNNPLLKILEKMRDYFAGYSTQKKFLVAGMASLILVGVSLGVMLVRQDPYQLLYSELQPEDAKLIAKKLGEQNIPFKISEDRGTISVPGTMVANARMQLAKEGLPGQDVVGFEKFDSTTLGMSSYVQKIQYVRAIQGELTRSIQRLSSVRHARVHISLPPKKVFLEEEEPPKASVVLELRQGQAPTKAEVNGIAHLVASAVEGLKVHNVTIVDNGGNFLHRPDDNSVAGVSSSLVELQRSIEVDYEKRIQELLTPVVGLGKVRAKVTAEVDSSRTNTMEESYDPEKATVRSSMKTDETTSGSRPNPIGIPGSRSNLPGTEGTNPAVPVASSTSEKNTQNNNYAIPRKVQTIDKPSGGIKRLTVSVVVDGHYQKAIDPKQPETYVPRTEEELRRLQDIVANAVGFDPQRRDAITVNSLPFKTADVFSAEELQAEKPFNWKDYLPMAIRNGAIGLVILLFFFLIIRPFLKWATLQDVEKEVSLLPKTVAELEAARKEEGILSLSKAANGGALMGENESLEKKEEEDLKTKILEKLNAAPKKGYRIVQDWLDDEALPNAENRALSASVA